MGEAKQKAKRRQTSPSGAIEQGYEKIPEKPGLIQLAATLLHSEQPAEMGDEGLEPPTSSV